MVLRCGSSFRRGSELIEKRNQQRATAGSQPAIALWCLCGEENQARLAAAPERVMTRKVYPDQHSKRNPLSERGYRGYLPPPLEQLRPYVVAHDDTIRAILGAQATIKSTIKALEQQHEQLADQLAHYAETKLER
jgi:hypothetical protein